jgi:hypothetical protein
LLNAVTASNSSTSSITLMETANGGAGGSGDPVDTPTDSGDGGAGGAATAEQTITAADSTSLSVQDNAYGGVGGSAYNAANGGAGGAATAKTTATGPGAVSANSYATGGWSLLSGGAATATVNATGASTSSTAYATAGGSDTAGAEATAIGTGDAASGSVNTTAISAPQTNTTHAAVTLSSIEAQAGISMYGVAASVESLTNYGGGLITPQAGLANVAEGIAAPTSYATIFADNSKISTAFGAGAVFEMGELGGAHIGTGAASQTDTSQVTAEIDLANLSSGGDFVLGLFDGAVTKSADVSQVTIDVTAGGVTLYSANFTGANVLAGFTDAAPTLSDAAFTNSGSTTVDISLSVTTTASGAGFTGDFIFGDPPVNSPQAQSANGAGTAAPSASSAPSANTRGPASLPLLQQYLAAGIGTGQSAMTDHIAYGFAGQDNGGMLVAQR